MEGTLSGLLKPYKESEQLRIFAHSLYFYGRQFAPWEMMVNKNCRQNTHNMIILFI